MLKRIWILISRPAAVPTWIWEARGEIYAGGRGDFHGLFDTLFSDPGATLSKLLTLQLVFDDEALPRKFVDRLRY